MHTYPQSGILVEAEEFDDFGGWVLDSQFEIEIGSPYLLAHGNGRPVADATTTISIPDTAQYNMWVRAKDWVPGHHPGKFTLVINGRSLPVTFDANDQGWSWEFGGKVQLTSVDEAARGWRRQLRGLPSQPVNAGNFDVVVVGGGVAGTAAALAAARLGERVALVQDRPYLGGNASLEIGLSPRGWTGPLVDEFSKRTPDGDLRAVQLLNAEPTATLFLEHTVFHAVTAASTIVSIDARNARSGREICVSAPIFIDCSGTAILGIISGAETLFGQESKAEYGESLAPIKGDNMHHGNTVFFRTRMADSPVPFPAVPWAADLRKPGAENGPGPVVLPPNHIPDTTIRGRLTHFWEYGQWLDPYTQGEQIRDYLLRAIYGTFSNVKSAEPVTYANLDFDWVAYVPAQGEYHQYKGDYVLTETDIRTHQSFHDAVVQNDGAFCLHYPGHDKYDFRLKYWEWDERDKKPYDIPFRCLYSADITNLLMAGKHMSATHVASSNTKFMGNGGHHGIATAAAAHLCRKYSTTPRGIYESHLVELQTIAAGIVQKNHYVQREARM